MLRCFGLLRLGFSLGAETAEIGEVDLRRGFGVRCSGRISAVVLILADSLEPVRTRVPHTL